MKTQLVSIILNSMRSKTMWALIILVLQQSSDWVDVQVWSADPAINELVSQVVKALSMALIGYGRIVAGGPLTK